MPVRKRLLDLLRTTPPGQDEPSAHADLPSGLKRDVSSVRLAMLQRLSASRLFARGDRAGVLRSAQRRSGRAFRLDMRQRVIVKALVSRHGGAGGARSAALAAHVAYLGRAGAGLGGSRPDFFGRDDDGLATKTLAQDWSADRHHFRFIVAPEHGDRLRDLRAYVRDVMSRVSDDLGQPGLEWAATCHFDTDRPHAHVLVRGRRADGRDLVIPRAYIAYGFRLRAQEVAQERLGDLSRADAERRIWRETQADRFTGFDRRLLQSADANGFVDDRAGDGDTWSALTRGRLYRLEALGLARHTGCRYQLAADLEPQLRRLEIRQDVIRTQNARSLFTGRDVRELVAGQVRGSVVARGHHGELARAPWVIVADAAGDEHFARLSLGHASPRVGQSILLAATSRGVQVVRRGLDAGLGP